MTRIGLISLDIWMTLIKSNPEFKTDRSYIIAKALGMADKTEIVKTVASAVDDELDAITEQTGEDFDFKARFLRIAEKLALDTFSFTEAQLKDVEQKVGEAFMEATPSLIESDILSTLASLKEKNIKIALVSNTGFVRGDTMRKALEKLGILAFADYTLFSNEMGIAKPHPKVFQLLNERSGETSEAIIHVGDNKENDYYGALRAGLHAVYFNVKGIVEENNKNIKMIRKLSELPELIGRDYVAEKGL